MSKTNLVIEILYSSPKRGSPPFSNLVENLEEIRKIHGVTSKNALNKFLTIASFEEQDAYYKEVVKYLSKDLCQQILSTRISPSEKQRRLLRFVALCRECFIETSLNHFLGASDAVLNPIYKSYQEKIKKLRDSKRIQ